MINIVVCVTNYKNKLAIGRNGDLLFKLKEDMKFFKNLTSNSLSKESKLTKNIVLMGRKTYFSIPLKFRPLNNRINIVLTRDSELMKISPIPSNLKLTKDVYYTDLDTFNKVYIKYNPNVFVIGGSELYNLFLKRASKLYVTHVEDTKFEKGKEPDTFMNYFTSDYKLDGMSEKYIQQDVNYRILYYSKSKKLSEESNYLNLMDEILTCGNKRTDRTGTGTLSIFGARMKFDISRNIPMMTTKKVPFKTILEELLFFVRGDTDAKILQKKGIKIWDGNTSREFLDKRGLNHYEIGIMGPMYGYSWCHFGAEYSQDFADTSKIDTSIIGGVNQLQNAIDLLKTDPYSRRIIISAWDPTMMDKMVLANCHILLQFYVTEENGVKYLSCQFYQRSSDQLAFCFNVVSYSILTHILAKKCDMKPKDIIYIAGDTHIYLNHIQGVKEQLNRQTLPLPNLLVKDCVRDKSWSDITADDFEMIGYFSHPFIKMPMAI